MSKFTIVLLSALALVLVCAAFVAIWAIIPVSVDRSKSDPAVTYANLVSRSSTELIEDHFEHSGLTLHYVEGGAGQERETVIFLHGFPSYWYSFSRQIEALKADYHVVAIDGLGAGKSDAPRESEHYKLEAMSDHLIALIDRLGAERVHLVGHDWGSAFAIGFAQRHPDRVITVTGISAPPTNASLYVLREDEKAREAATYIERFKGANPVLIVALGGDTAVYKSAYQPLVEDGLLTAEEGELFREATEDARRINAHINWYRANLPHPDEITDANIWPSLDARVTVPSLYIWGEDDQIFNQAAMDRMLSLSDDPELILFPKIGHWPHVRKADEVNAAIRAHISAASDR